MAPSPSNVLRRENEQSRHNLSGGQSHVPVLKSHVLPSQKPPFFVAGQGHAPPLYKVAVSEYCNVSLLVMPFTPL